MSKITSPPRRPLKTLVMRHTSLSAYFRVCFRPDIVALHTELADYLLAVRVELVVIPTAAK